MRRILLALALLFPARVLAQPSYTLALSEQSANGVRVTVTLENTQAGSGPMLIGVNELLITLHGAGSCFVSGPCGWGPKSVAQVGAVGMEPITSLVDGNTWTARQSDWMLDFGGGSTLGWGWRFGSSLGIIGCADARMMNEFEWASTRFYSARTCDAEGLTGAMQFSTFVTVNNSAGGGLNGNALTTASFGVSFGTREVALITPEPASALLLAPPLIAVALLRRRFRLRSPT